MTALVAIVFAGMQIVSSSVHGPSAPAMPSVPASAPLVAGEVRPWPGSGVQQVFSDIRRGRDSGQLSHDQAKELRQEADMVGVLQERYARDGLSDDERAELHTRAEILRAKVSAARLGVIK